MGTIVGFLALTVAPPPPVNVSSRQLPAGEAARRLKWVVGEARTAGYLPESTMWMRCFAAAPGFEAASALVLLRTAMASVPYVDKLLYACPAALKVGRVDVNEQLGLEPLPASWLA